MLMRGSIACWEMTGNELDEIMDLDLVNEFFLGDWQESLDCFGKFQQGVSTLDNSLSSGIPHLPGFTRWHSGSKEVKNWNRDEQKGDRESGCFRSCQTSSSEGSTGFLSRRQSFDSRGCTVEEHVTCTFDRSHEQRSLDTEHVANNGHASSTLERLTCVLKYIKESNRGEILIQIWMPVKIGGKLVLSTCGLPFWCDSDCQRLTSYRTVSAHYQFSAEDNSEDALGLPGRVFVGELPEWTPDVRFFSSYEYPRVSHAQQYDVRGSIALPVFERGGRSCLGVIEVVMTTEKINYCSDLDNICKALQAVNLRSSEAFNISHVKVKTDYFQAVLPEISEVLKVACEAHKLPLAQTWIPCIQQGKWGSRHTYDNYNYCISTADVACHINDPYVLGFHEACSEHHLFKGQGVAGEAFFTNEPCFVSDITNYSRTEYPLSHFARLFNLRGAVAIRLRSTLSGNTDFVLEFFLPAECVGSEEQKSILNMLPNTIHLVSRSLRVVTAAELECEGFLPDHNSASGVSLGNLLFEQVPHTDVTSSVYLNGTSNIANLHQIDKNRRVSDHLTSQPRNQENLGVFIKERSQEEAVLPLRQIYTEVQLQPDSLHGANHEEGSVFDIKSSKTEIIAEKKQSKAEKVINLRLLQQYFSGSLKDAARDIGVCPTTLKRICRQHGITRWPSRKIKKVSHSLKKLQIVIDSVEGVDKTYPFSSLYVNSSNPSRSNSDIQISSVDKGSLLLNHVPSPETLSAPSVLHRSHASTTNSHSSSSSQNSSSRNHWSSGEKKEGNSSYVEIQENFKCSQSSTLHGGNESVCISTEEPASLVSRDYSQRNFSRHSQGTLSSQYCSNRSIDLLGIKVTYGEEKVRFKMQPSWGLRHLKLEIAYRFDICDPTTMELEYLDDDSEKVLLTCDADLQECITVHRSSVAHIIKIYVSVL